MTRYTVRSFVARTVRLDTVEAMVAVVVVLSGFALWLAGSLASFGCVVAERTVRHESINGRSHCGCGRQLSVGENIPVLGWVRAKGRTTCCDSLIPRWYVVAEGGAMAAAVMGVVVGAGLGGVRGGVVGGAGSSVVAMLVVIWVGRRRERKRGGPASHDGSGAMGGSVGAAGEGTVPS